ncbi:hypothetical protein NMG60_11015269 [Bertholletia excelsa]
MGITLLCKKHLVLTLIISILLHFLPTSSTECRCQTPPPAPQPDILKFLDQRIAIVYPVIQRFKIIITSDPLGVTRSWVGSDVCNYIGFYCDNPPDNTSAIAIASIDFNGFRLAAPTLEGFIDQLPDLAIFHANTNNFAGTIPASISKLPYLYELDLSNNNLSGVFPTAVLLADGLTFLDLRFNFFTGTVPTTIFKKSLDVLFINNNLFTQRLPDDLGSTSAVYLTFANNRFTGPIPRSIGNARSTLLEVLFLNNLLTGFLPYEIGFLRNARVFDAGNNLLVGPLPCSLGCLEKIEQLNFAGNFLCGQIPEAVCALGNLMNLSLSNNYFTKVGPLCMKLIKTGVLDVRKNCIPGLPGQRSPHECSVFFWQPRYCPYSAWYHNIPCKLPTYHNYSLPPSSPRPSALNENSVTYSALHRHRL